MVRLGELVSIKHGWPFKSQYFSDYQPERPIVVNIGNFRYSGGFRFESTTIKSYIGGYPAEFILEPDDILLVMTCQTAGGEILGIPGRIPNDGRQYLHNQRMGRVVIKDGDKIDQRYLYWLFLVPDFNQHLTSTATGAKILHTAPSRIESFQFHLPPLPTQHKIAAILSAYDDLIENNTRRISILEEMAQSLYREWFVQFRFPGHEKKKMIESTLGMIPERWEVVKFIKIAELSRDNINPGKFEFEKFAHYSLPAFDEGCMPVNEYGQSIKSNKFLVHEGSVLLSKLNPRIPRVWLPMLSLSERAIASTEFMVFVPKRPYTREMLYCCCQSTEFMDRFAGRSGGTSTSHQRVKPEDLLNLPIVLPESSIVDAFTEITSPMFKIIHNLRLKIVNLRLTRDLLLPRLISGEIDVEGLEIETGEEIKASVVSTEKDMKSEEVVLAGEQGTLWG
jgi:type I restriction enzyme, S subunit